MLKQVYRKTVPVLIAEKIAKKQKGGLMSMESFKSVFASLLLLNLVSCASNRSPDEIASDVLRNMLVPIPAKDPLGEFASCQGDPQYWNNCYGEIMVNAAGTDAHRLVHGGVYRNGKSFDRTVIRNPNTRETCKGLRNPGNPRELIQTCDRDGVFTSRQVFVDDVLSIERGIEISNFEMSKECATLGFRENTPEMGNCILRLRELQKAKQPAQVAQPSALNPSTADKLEGLSQLLRIIHGAGQVQRSNPGSTTPSPGVLCVKSSEYTSGLYKTCVYKCVGGEATQTVSTGQACPASARF